MDKNNKNGGGKPGAGNRNGGDDGPPDPLPAHQIPLSGINPFVQPYKPTRGKETFKRWDEDKFISELGRAQAEDDEIQNDQSPEATEWHIARDTHFMTNGRFSAHADFGWKRRVEPYIFRHGGLKSTHLVSLTKGIPGIDDGTRRYVKSAVIRHQSNIQHAVTKYFLVTMGHLVAFCPEFHDATDAQRADLLLRLFNGARLTIYRNAFLTEASSIGFDNIFRSNEGERPKWQMLVRSEFVMLALSTYHLRIVGNNKNKLFKAYQAHVDGDNVKAFGLGEVDDVSRRAPLLRPW